MIQRHRQGAAFRTFWSRFGASRVRRGGDKVDKHWLAEKRFSNCTEQGASPAFEEPLGAPGGFRNPPATFGYFRSFRKYRPRGSGSRGKQKAFKKHA